jgi:purine-binding chemotaxis protein CheW
MKQYLTVRLGAQTFALPVLQAEEIIRPPFITPVFFAPSAVQGIINLRGRIIVAVDMGLALGLDASTAAVYVVTSWRGEGYALAVDAAGAVMTPAEDDILPPLMRGRLPDVAAFSCRHEGNNVIVLDHAALFGGIA